MFSQPTTAPWEVIGNQSGYAKVQFARILNHPDFKRPYQRMITEALESVLSMERNASPSIKQLGFTLDDITQIQGGFDLFWPDGPCASIGFGVANIEITAANPVDWPKVIRAFDLEKSRRLFFGEDPEFPLSNLEKSRDHWLDSATKSRSNLFATDSLWTQLYNVIWKTPSETKREVWETVSGGAVTIVYDIPPAELPEDFQETDAIEQANIQMTIATEIAAWGVDLSHDYETCQLRFVAVPREGVSTDDLLKKFETLKNACAQSDVDDALSMHFLEQLKKAKTTIVESKRRNGEITEAYLLVEGECSADLSGWVEQ